MRLWSLHPGYLDAKGLVALWREALLAQAVLRGATRGYTNHPQLVRFRACRNPLAALTSYLWGVHAEAEKRGYAFNSLKIALPPGSQQLTVTAGQLKYEHRHLCRKLSIRDQATYLRIQAVQQPAPHPIFNVVPGDRAPWEKGP